MKAALQPLPGVADLRIDTANDLVSVVVEKGKFDSEEGVKKLIEKGFKDVSLKN